MNKAVKKLFLIILCSLLSVSFGFSQAGRGKGRIKGVVKNEKGHPVKSAKVEIQFLENEQVKRETTTDKNGEWAFLGLGTGKWRITASAEGYIPSSKDIYVRQLQRNPLVTLTLKPVEKSDESIIQDKASLKLLEKGNKLFEEKKYDQAIAIYEQFLEQNPQAYQTHINIAESYREKENYEKAIQEYNLVLEKAEKDKDMGKEMKAKALSGIGEVYLKNGNLKKAQEFFKQSIEAFPQNEILPYNVGEIYFSNQKTDQAVKYFKMATEMKPDWPDPYLKLGYVYLNTGENDKAIRNFEKFLQLEPDSERSTRVKKILEYLTTKSALPPPTYNMEDSLT